LLSHPLFQICFRSSSHKRRRDCPARAREIPYSSRPYPSWISQCRCRPKGLFQARKKARVLVLMKLDKA
jgi:hypothetical protein